MREAKEAERKRFAEVETRRLFRRGQIRRGRWSRWAHRRTLQRMKLPVQGIVGRDRVVNRILPPHNRENREERESRYKFRQERIAEVEAKASWMKRCQVVPPADGSCVGVQIFVRTVEGKTVTLDVHLDGDLEALKDAFGSKLGRNFDGDRFIFCNHQLQGGRSLASYGMEKGSTLHHLSSLGGGGGRNLPPHVIDQMRRTATPAKKFRTKKGQDEEDPAGDAQ